MPPELVFIVAVALAVLLVAFLRRIPKLTRTMPYVRCEALLSKGELAFCRVLQPAVPDWAALCLKVRLADVITVSPADWQEYGRRIAGMHLDFVLIDAATTAVLLAIELDDRTHAQRERRQRDELVNAALGSAGVPLLRVKAAARYDAGEVRRIVAGALAGGV